MVGYLRFKEQSNIPVSVIVCPLSTADEIIPPSVVAIMVIPWLSNQFMASEVVESTKNKRQEQ